MAVSDHPLTSHVPRCAFQQNLLHGTEVTPPSLWFHKSSFLPFSRSPQVHIFKFPYHSHRQLFPPPPVQPMPEHHHEFQAEISHSTQPDPPLTQPHAPGSEQRPGPPAPSHPLQGPTTTGGDPVPPLRIPPSPSAPGGRGPLTPRPTHPAQVPDDRRQLPRRPPAGHIQEEGPPTERPRRSRHTEEKPPAALRRRLNFPPPCS